MDDYEAFRINSEFGLEDESVPLTEILHGDFINKLYEDLFEVQCIMSLNCKAWKNKNANQKLCQNMLIERLHRARGELVLQIDVEPSIKWMLKGFFYQSLRFKFSILFCYSISS